MLKKLEQLRSLGKCISLTLLSMSVLYFFTRIGNYMELKDTKHVANQSYGLGDAKLQLKFENMELLHVVTIVHSITCIIISGVIYHMLKNHSYIDRRQFFLILGMTTSVTILYFFSILYVVYMSTFARSDDYDVLTILESMLDVIGSLSNDTLSFLFALMMNFFLLLGIFLLNICSLYMAEVAKSIEQRRTGGRNQNELELNSFSISKQSAFKDKIEARMPD